jgi:glycosyltransferase involved in cell wall biosynthesis
LISVIVPCRNERLHIVGAVQSLLQQASDDLPIEVIVADGMSTDGTRELLADLSRTDARIRVVDNPGRIVSSGLNRAIAAARGEIVVRADSHTVYAADYLRRCVEALRSTAADCVGGPWVARGGAYTSRAVAAAFQSPFAVGAARSHDPGHDGPVDSVYLGCWFRATLDRFGPFDEDLVRNQDDEYCLRIHRAGGTVWQSRSIQSWYTPRNSFAAVFRQYAQYGYWKVFVIRKHRLPASARHLAPAAAVLFLAILVVLALFSPLARTGLMVVVASYLALCLAFAARAARREPRLLPGIIVAFWAFHFGYGIGFWGALLDTAAGVRRFARSMSTLTRND